MATAVAAMCAPAGAEDVVAGAVRDQDGAVVAGAPVAAFDAAGRVLARARTAGDGTFALVTPALPAAVEIAPDDAEPLRVAPAPGAPIAAIVRRHRAADRIPSVADVAALPAGLLGQLGAVVPYRVAFPGALSDRWLARGRGVTTIEGMPFYRRGDGADATGLLPAHAVGTVGVREPLDAPWYGDRAGAGVVDARLFDRLDDVRIGGRAGAVLVQHSLLAAASWDGDGARRVIAARGDRALGPVNAALVGVLGEAPGTHYAGVGADLHAALARVDVGARFDLTRDVARVPARDASSVAQALVDIAGRGAEALAVRLRWRAERGTLGDADAQHRDAALVLGTTRGERVRVNAAVALAYGDQTAYETPGNAALAVLPSLTLDAALGRQWLVHAGAGASSLGTAGFALARASLGEAALTYTDRRRLRIEALAYAERDGSPSAINRGLAASLGWEIAPRVSLRAWTLRDGDAVNASAPAYPGGPLQSIAIRRRFFRDVAWLTWDAPTRLDVVLRAGSVEGNLRLPLTRAVALTLGSYRRTTGTRAFDVGLVGR